MRRWTLVLWVLVGCSKPATSRAYSEIVALDDGSALITWHDRGRTFGVSRLDPSASFRWSADLEGRPHSLPPDHGVIVRDRLVALHTYHRSEHQLMAEGVSLDDGRRSWVTRLRAVRSSGEGVDRFSGFATDHSIRMYLRPDRGADRSELIDLDPKTGGELGRTKLPLTKTTGETIATLSGDLIVSSALSKVIVANGADVTTLESRGFGCVIASEYWRLVRTAERWELAPTRDKTRRPIPVEPLAPGRELMLMGCGGYRDTFVLFLHAASNTELRILDGEGKVLRRASLGDRQPTDAVWATVRSTSSAEGLPRFTPVLLGNNAEVLAMLDLEQAAIVWQAPSDLMAAGFRSGPRWYWTWPLRRDGTMIVILDGDTGLGKAVHVRDPYLLQPLGPRNVAGDSLWLLAGLDSASPTSAPVARLDAKTLQVLAANGEFVLTEVPFDSLKEPRNR